MRSRVFKCCSEQVPQTLSTLDPTSTVFVSRNETKTCLRSAQLKKQKAVFVFLNTVPSPGFEPGLPAPQAGVLSIELRGQKTTLYVAFDYTKKSFRLPLKTQPLHKFVSNRFLVLIFRKKVEQKIMHCINLNSFKWNNNVWFKYLT